MLIYLWFEVDLVVAVVVDFVAKQLQGGGHPNASGASLPNTVQRIPDAVEYLKKVLNPELDGEGLGSLESALKGL